MQSFEGKTSETVRLTLSSLVIYPVKSCHGIRVSEARVGPRGLEHDREWMWVDESGCFVTQRELPWLARVETSMTEGHLVLRYPGRPELRVPLAADRRRSVSVRIWRDACQAWDEGDAAADWIADLSGRPLRLVRFSTEHHRPCDAQWVGTDPAEAAFADAYPVLVISEESLAELNRRIVGDGPLPMDRFRPNVVVRGGTPYIEDAAKILRADEVVLRLVKPCVRCRITTTDQTTAAVGVEPLRTLATYRKHAELRGVVFGQNAIPLRGVGQWLRVGMEVLASLS